MCIINRAVEKVSNTSLFAAKLAEVTLPNGMKVQRQLTIYSNEVATKTENQMILPFPTVAAIPLEDQVVLHDICSLKDRNLFAEINKMFRDKLISLVLAQR
jgi:hypothetical protein